MRRTPCRLGAEREPEADLAGTLRDHKRKNTVEAERREQRRHDRERPGQRQEEPVDAETAAP